LNYRDHQINEIEMAGNRTLVWRKRNACKVLVGKRIGERPFGRSRKDGMIILESILEK
jgi:hypothetical protein